MYSFETMLQYALLACLFYIAIYSAIKIWSNRGLKGIFHKPRFRKTHIQK